MNRVSVGILAVLAGLAQASEARAAGRMIHAEPMFGEKVRIDGDLREWPNKMTELGDTLRGKIAGGEPRAAVTIGYDEATLYVVMKVTDNRIARSSGTGPSEDHATLMLYFPKGKTHEVDLYPGASGKSAGVVKMGGSFVKGAKIVEAPTEQGYTLEASLPWSAFPEAAKLRVGLRAAVRLTDADAPGAVKAVIATASGSGRALPPLLLSTEQGLERSLLRDKGLSSNPAREAYGNVAGDAMLERVAVFGPYLSITGPSFRGGKEFYYGELGVESAAMVRKLSLVDFDGDGLDEIVIQKRIGAKDRYREIVQVMKVGKDDTPFDAFAHEVGIKTPDGYVQNRVTVSRAGIEIAQGDQDGFDPATYDEVMPSNMGSALLPWESVKSRSFKWQGGGMKPAGETSWTPKVAGPGKKPSGGKAPPAERVGPPAPRPPSVDELLDRVYALYKRDRGVRGGKPRFDFVTDVAGDTGTERVVIHDRDIVVFGKGFKGGTSYAYITVGVADGKDILDATARDLTGDGKAEIIVRGVLHAKASKELGGDTVDRYALFVYSLQSDRVTRVFAAETGRAVEKSRVLGTVAFLPANDGAVRIELRQGRAVGWTERSYPFPEDTTAAGGLEPLLLPWGEKPTRSYQWSGSAFSAGP